MSVGSEQENMQGGEILVPREIAHALWYEGGRLRTNLDASLVMHPENWHEAGAKQRIAEWDKAAERYFDYAINPKSAASSAAKPAQPGERELMERMADCLRGILSTHESVLSSSGAFDLGRSLLSEYESRTRG